MSQEDTLLTVEQVAEMAHLRPRTIRVKINQGLLRAYKPPRSKRWLIRHTDAQKLLTGEPVPQNFPPPFLIDRLGTPEGRARAVAALRTLGNDRDEEEQRVSGERLRQVRAEGPLQMRRWDVVTGERQDAAP